jgi:hypothetical protein
LYDKIIIDENDNEENKIPCFVKKNCKVNPSTLEELDNIIQNYECP